MALLLYILLFFILFKVGKAVWKFYGIYRKLYETTRQFRNFNTQQNADTYGYGTNRNNSYNTNSYNTSKTTTSTGDVIEDRRTEDKINRKIFTQEEGEYIDFEEEK